MRSAFVPQHRERIIIAACRSRKIVMPAALTHRPWPLSAILESRVDARYTLSDKLWTYLQHHAAKHKALGNGFGFGLADPKGVSRHFRLDTTRTAAKSSFRNKARTLVGSRPRECARLMGFPESFVIPVSDTQAYRQFGNSVCVPLMEYVARHVVAQLEDALLRPVRRTRSGALITA